jgi:GcrA cell cycle regulator
MGGHVNTVWADEHSSALLAFLADGMSFSQSASALNEKFSTSYSRNAACGKAFRLNFKVPKRAKAVRTPRKRDRERIIPAIKPKPRIEEIQIRCAEIEPRHITLDQLERDDCRYPFGEGPFTFCGRQIEEGRSYCPEHQWLATTRPRTTSEAGTENRARHMRRLNYRKALLQEAMA